MACYCKQQSGVKYENLDFNKYYEYVLIVEIPHIQASLDHAKLTHEFLI